MGHQIQTNKFEISGYVSDVLGVERISDKLSKRKLILQVTRNKWSDYVPFEFRNTNVTAISSIKEGDWVTIEFELSARMQEKEGQPVRYFVTLIGLSCIKN
jgi:hypothetical protein